MKTCKCCGSQIEVNPVLFYHNLPGLAQNFPDKDKLVFDKGIDLAVYQCPFCGLLQLLQEPVYYYRDVIRSVAVSESMQEFRKSYFRNFVQRGNLQGNRLIEIGAGCGEYMEIMQQNGVQVFGIEHLKSSVVAGKKRGLAIFEGFVENETYRLPGAPYDAFYTLNFLEHIPNPKSFLKGIAANLAENAYGLVEVPNGDFIIRNQMFSEFMLDHLSYFTKETLSLLLAQSGFEVISCEIIWNEYIIAATVKKRKELDTGTFLKRQEQLIHAIGHYLDTKLHEGKKIAVWGAGHQALAIMALANMKGKIECVVDSAAFKQNRYTPATHIPIYAPKMIKQLEIDTVIIMAGSYSNEISKIIEGKYPGVESESIDGIIRNYA